MPNAGLKKENLVDYAEYMDLYGQLQSASELFTYYDSAMREVETRLNMLNEYYSMYSEQNPITAIHTRLKSTDSIFEKLKRRGFPVSVQSIIDKYIQ